MNMVKYPLGNFRAAALFFSLCKLQSESRSQSLGQHRYLSHWGANISVLPKAYTSAHSSSRCEVMNASEESALVGALTVADLKRMIRKEIRRGLLEANGTAAKTEPKPYLSVKEAAETACIAVSTIRLYIRKGQLKALRVGRRVVVWRVDLERFLSLNPTGVLH
jgi:excisionase family DNA binding protein